MAPCLFFIFNLARKKIAIAHKMDYLKCKIFPIHKFKECITMINSIGIYNSPRRVVSVCFPQYTLSNRANIKI